MERELSPAETLRAQDEIVSRHLDGCVEAIGEDRNIFELALGVATAR